MAGGLAAAFRRDASAGARAARRESRWRATLAPTVRAVVSHEQVEGRLASGLLRGPFDGDLRIRNRGQASGGCVSSTYPTLTRSNHRHASGS